MRTGRPAATSGLARQTLAVVMAGGSGTRLGALTRRHAKPALPFAGQYRNIDFTLSNCINSGIRRVGLLTQYKAHSLIQHVQQGWSFLPGATGEFVQVWPAQQRRGVSWYAGTADAVYQNLDLIEELAPRYVLVLAGDHIYKMDYLGMLTAHAASGARATVACIEAPLEQARGCGVVGVDAEGWIERFEEKPAHPTPMPQDPRQALVSMGIYVFDLELLAERLTADAKDADSRHDFGHDLLPALTRDTDVLSYRFRDPRTGASAYWRDVGTLDGYWQAHMELLGDEREIDLHDEEWPIWTHQIQAPPPRFVGDGTALRSIVSAGCSVAGRVERSVLGPNCRIGHGSLVEASVVLPGVTVGRGCRITRAIIEPGCTVEDGTIIGRDALADARCYDVTAAGVRVVTADGLARAAALAKVVPASPGKPHQAEAARARAFASEAARDGAAAAMRRCAV